MAMIEAELGFFQMQIERVSVHPIELHPPAFGIAPEALDTSGRTDLNEPYWVRYRLESQELRH